MSLKPVVEAVLVARLRRAAIFVIVGLLLWSYNAYGIEFTIKDNLTDDMFGVPKGTVDAVVKQAANFWVTNLPDHPGFVKDLAGAVKFTVTFEGINIDNTGGNPAGTSAVNAGTARPTNDNAFFTIFINTANKAKAAMFWDTTPAVQEKTEFTEDAKIKGRFTAVKDGPADSKFDMLTIITHELGHVITYNNYTDFNDFIKDTWNDGDGGRTDVKLPEDHFDGGMNLMTLFAALPNGKNGRVFAQPEDYLPIPVAEPSTALLLGYGFTVVVALHYWRQSFTSGCLTER